MDRNSQHTNYVRAHIMRSRWYKVFIAAAAIVVFITTYMLILPAITLDAKCGKEEHTHTEECYKEKASMTCQLEESAGHTHTEACYQTIDNLICGMEESEPVVDTVVNEETGETETVVVSEGHTHDAGCYAQEVQLICGQEESAGHTHTDSCYTKEKVLDCTKEEHKHTDACFHEQSDPNADLESEAIWTQTFANVQLTGKWNEDVVAIAKTQVGYKESSRNFIYDDEDEKDGYTRYGAWYGDPYGEWCAMFSSFCLHYAGVGYDANNVAFPLESNCANWINKLQQVGYYHDAASSLYMDQMGRETYTGNDYFVKPGDLIFFNLKNSQYVVSDHVGIVTDVTERKISTIQGNSNYSVLEKDYNVGDVTIVGFGEIPENPNYVDPNKKDETKEEANADSSVSKKKTVSKVLSANKADETTEPIADSFAAARSFGISPLSDGEGIAPYSDGTATDMKNYVTAITVSKDNGGRWQESTQFQDGDRVRMDMTFDVPANVVTKDNPSIYYTFPAGLLAPGTDMSGNVYDHGVAVGVYEISTADDGEAVIVITYNDSFADGNSFTGTAFFTAEIALGEGQSSVEYAFDGTNTKITVTGKEAPYDIRTNKSATKSSDGKSVDYVVDISTTDGTDGNVIVSDSLYQGWQGENVGPATYKGTVTVEKYGADGQKIQGADTTFNVSGNTFEYELPELLAGQSYKLKYSVNVNTDYAADDGSFVIKNYANGKLKDHPYTQQGAYTETEISKTKITKYGSYNQITGQMDFTITINNPDGVDLGNREVVDVVTTQGISLIDHPVVTDVAGNVVNNGIFTDGDGKLFSYKFPSGSTATTYYIKYSTSAPAAQGATVDNTATYKGDGDREYHASSNPSVNHRDFGFTKSTRGQWVDDNGVDKFEWQTYMTLPDGNFPQNGYFYEDIIKDATQGNSTYPGTHYGIKSEIENKIHETFRLNVIENGQAVEKAWSAATNEYVDVQIKYYTEKGGQEVTDDNTEVKYFTVQVTPKNGKTFSAANMYFNYITSGNRNGFTDGKYYFPNDGAVGDSHSTPNHNVDMGDINPIKTRKDVSSDAKGEKVEWQASIDLPQSGLPVNGHLFEDQMEDAKDEDGVSYPGTHYGTVSEITSRIQETFTIKIGNENKNWSDAQSLVNVEMKFYKQENGQNIQTTSDNDHVTYFTVKVTPKDGQNVTASNITFNYPTRINQNGINGGFMKYSNTLKVNGKENTTTYSKRIMAALEKSVYIGNAGTWDYTVADYTDVNGKYVYSSKDGQEVDYKDGIITYRVLVKTGLGADNDQDITLTDTIPEGMEYVDGSAKAAAVIFYNMDNDNFNKTQSSAEMSNVHQNWAPNPEDTYVFNEHLHSSVTENVLTLKLDAGYASKDNYMSTYRGQNVDFGLVAIYYQVRITDPAWDNPTTLKKTYVNEATWEQTGHSTSQETKVIRPVEEVKKLATPVTDDEGHVIAINYNVIINPAAEDLNPESHVLELEDTMNPGMGTASMLLESIRLYAYDATKQDHIGVAIDPNRYQYHYDANAKKLNITIPDELACVLQYTYEVSPGQASRDYEVSNKVSLMGKDYDSNKVTMENQESGATSTKSKIILYKVDKDNYGKHLAGVEFSLHYMDEHSAWIAHEHDQDVSGEAGTLVTDTNGQIKFDNSPGEDFDVDTLKQNTLYRLVETNNPNPGYSVDDTPFYFVWLDGHTKADDWYNNNVSGKTFYHGDIAKDDIHFFEHEGASIYIENEYTLVSVKKVWVDEDGRDLINHPNDVTVELYESTRTRDVATITFNFVNNDGTTYKSLSKTVARGSGIKVSGWTQTVNSIVTVNPETQIEVNQYNDQYTPGSYVTLQSISQDTTVTIKQGVGQVKQYGAYDENGIWRTSFPATWGGTYDCPWYDEGNEITVYKQNSQETFIITVSSKMVEAAGEWNPSNANIENGSYIDESEAGYITGEGTVVDTVTLNASNNWNYTWGDDDTDYKLKADSFYYVKETAIGGKTPSETDYTVLYQNNNGIKTGEILVTNRIPKQEIQPEKTDISIEKKWVDPTDKELTGDALNGKQAKFRLMQVVNDNVDAATEVSTFTLPENNSWSKEFTGLNKTTYDSQGNATHYKYYFEEIAEKNTEPTYQKESFWNFLPFINGTENAEKVLIDEGTVTVTNKLLPEKTSVSVEKKWKNADGSEDTSKYDDTNASVTVDLYKITDNNKPGEKIESNITLNKANSWKYEKKDLIKEEYKDGVKHTYTYYFVENAADGYKTTYKSSTSDEVMDASTIAANGGTFTVINKKQAKTSVTVNKKWFKNENGNISEVTGKTGTIEFDLYRVATKTGGDEPVDPVDPTCQHTWDSGTVTVQPTETASGTIVYTCTKCNETKTESISPTGHTHHYDDGQVTKPATCTSKGVITYTCSCDDKYTQDIPIDSTNHTGGTSVVGYREATVTESGYTGDTKWSCCGFIESYGEVIPATGGGEDPEPSGDVYTVTIYNSQWNSTVLGTVEVPEGESLIVTFDSTGSIEQMGYGWFTDYAYNGQKTNCSITQTGSYVVQHDEWNSTTWNSYQVVYKPTQNSSLYLNSISDTNFDWSVTEPALMSQDVSARSTVRMMAAPRNASAPVSETPIIPTGAVNLGTFQITDDMNWTGTWTFEAEPGYTYTYYVIEKDNPNYIVTYKGQGTGNVTINNTEVVNSYELPHTGGQGTKLITMLGILLMAVSSLMILKKHRKEEIW